MKQSPHQSQHIQSFYNAMQDWIDTSLPEHQLFSKQMGLCSNLVAWIEYLDLPEGSITLALNELRSSFDKADLYSTYPFNDGVSDYKSESAESRVYQNQMRLKWVRKHSTNAPSIYA